MQTAALFPAPGWLQTAELEHNCLLGFHIQAWGQPMQREGTCPGLKGQGSLSYFVVVTPCCRGPVGPVGSVGPTALCKGLGGAWGPCVLSQQLSPPVSLQLWKGRWQGNDIVIKMLKIRDWTTRKSRDFNEEYPKLR